jgi:hypothetical protein
MVVLDFSAKIAAPQIPRLFHCQARRPRSVRDAICFIRFISLISIPLFCGAGMDET